jgi:two-component system, NtrC family, sensor kinase
MISETDTRILIVDDNPAIHDDFAKILCSQDATADSLDDLEALLLETATAPTLPMITFELVSATQGEDALREVIAGVAANRPFALAFVDMRMPPGWDGLETIEQIWRVDPHIQIVICSAYSDYSWSEVRARVGTSDSLLIIKKPFDSIEVAQSAHTLTTKWALARKLRAQIDNLETAVAARTVDLEQANAHLAEQMRQREHVETELRLAQKLESVGRLAAGIAHEINTPIQYVGDNLAFLRESMSELVGATGAMLAAAIACRSDATAPLIGRLVEIANSADLAYLEKEIPSSVASISVGVERITTIVRAMRELAHPGPREAAAMDLPRALHNALEVTASSYRLVADVETDFAATPPVICFGSELNQVFLNVIVNAAQAIEDRKGQRGTLGVSTRVDGDSVVIAISDTGIGIPEANRERVFDAFFTTKDVGRGTGQGLAISRSIVVDRHGGSLTFDSKLGLGTTFWIRVPIAGPGLNAKLVAA